MVGAPDSFDDFYRDEMGKVLAVTMALTKRLGEAEDCAQEAFLRAYRDWDRVGRMEWPGAWTRRTALNLAVSRWRRMSAEARAFVRLGDRTEHHDDTTDPEFWAAVRRLPERQAQVVALTYVEDLDANQVGHVLGLAPGTVRVHLTRARRALADVLGETA